MEQQETWDNAHAKFLTLSQDKELYALFRAENPALFKVHTDMDLVELMGVTASLVQYVDDLVEKGPSDGMSKGQLAAAMKSMLVVIKWKGLIEERIKDIALVIDQETK